MNEQQRGPRLIDIVDQVLFVDMRLVARDSLVQVAGKDFNLDADAWRQWWSGQEPKR